MKYLKKNAGLWGRFASCVSWALITGVLVPSSAAMASEGEEYLPCDHIFASKVAEADNATIDGSRSYSSASNGRHVLLNLLKNIKRAIDDDLLLDEKFYTEEYLKSYFGAGKILWRSPGTAAYIEELSGVESTNDLIQLYVVRNSGNETPGGDISFSPLDPLNMSFEEVENFFGKKWTANPYKIPPYDSVFQPLTHPHGNDRIKYTCAEGSIRTYIGLEFGADGNLTSAYFRETESR
jgi:hypothetical protein